MKTATFNIVLGGYYAYRYNDAAEWSVIRLLDIQPKDAIHYAPFQEKYPSIPTAEQIFSTKPYILHVPVSTMDLFNFKDITLITEKPLEDADLEGYAYYLEHSAGMPKEEVESEISQIKSISHSHQNQRLTLEEQEGQLSFKVEPAN